MDYEAHVEGDAAPLYVRRERPGPHVGHSTAADGAARLGEVVAYGGGEAEHKYVTDLPGSELGDKVEQQPQPPPVSVQQDELATAAV